jgi:hypothetical protein
MKPFAFSLLALGIACVPAWAQSAPAGQPPRTADQSQRDRVLEATKLPHKAQDIRDKGVPQGEVKEALDAARSKRVHAGEMSQVADGASRDIDQHGRIDNFGHFVKGKLDQGLRGRELAAAIHDEHARRGMGPNKAGKANQGRGRGNAADRDDGRDDKGKAEDRGREKEREKDKDKGKPADKPKGKGKPGGEVRS